MAAGAIRANRSLAERLVCFSKRVQHALPLRRELMRGHVYRLLHPSARARKQIVICGFPRSGTSLLYNMLAGGLSGFAHDEFEVSAHRSIWRFEDHVSKLPLDILRLPELARSNVHGKDLHVLVPIRDPRDLVTSVHPNVPDDYFIGWEASYRVGVGEAGSPALVMPGIREILEALEIATRTPGLDLIQVRYEELVLEPDRVDHALSQRMQLQFQTRFANFHQEASRLPYRYDAAHTRAGADLSRARETGPLDRGRVGKWRDPAHRSRIREQFGRHPELLALVRIWNYERDDAWFAAYSASDAQR